MPDHKSEAERLIETAADLQRQILVKHTTAILEQFHSEITTRDAQLAAVTADRNMIDFALKEYEAALATREEEVKRLRESDVRYRGFVEWFDLYGVSINTVADPRGSYRLNWHRGEVFGNTMNELIDAVDTSIAATKEPTR